MTLCKLSVLATAVGMAGLVPAIATAQEYSTSIIRPTVLAADNGVVAGPLPGGRGARSYYIAADLKAGELSTQIKVSAPSDETRMVSFELLGPNASVVDSYYVKTSFEEQNQATRTFPIGSTRRYNMRVIVEGPETGDFCVLLGGSALPGVKAPECPGATRPAAAPPPAAPARAAAPPPPAPPKTVEVITTKCEQRLRVGSEVLFDFDRAELRPDAMTTMDYVADVIATQKKPVTIEGHTDSKGSDSYNSRLSQLRAIGVEVELRRRIKDMPPLQAFGYGETKPVAANEMPDGSDYPLGRQLNRRVEIVINTCA
jgi:outer membrane protein OmpA-like peptidoglycan-associated protein